MLNPICPLLFLLAHRHYGVYGFNNDLSKAKINNILESHPFLPAKKIKKK
jgi:hypothetical protein